MQIPSRLNSFLYFSYLLILCWSPLPLGSNRNWALAILLALIFLLSIGVLLAIVFKKLNIRDVLNPYWFPLSLLLLVALWTAIQCLPLPLELVRVVSPLAGEAYSQISTASGAAYISLDPDKTLALSLYTWALLFFSIISILLHDTPKRVRTTCIVIVLCGVSQALYGSIMILSGAEYGFFFEKEHYLGVATGTFVNRNHLAGYLEMCLAVGIGLLVANLVKGRTGWRNHVRGALDSLLGPKLRLRVYLALMVIGLVLTHSRMGNTAFFASLFFCGALMMILQRKLHMGAVILFASLLLVDFLIVGQWFGFEELVQRLESTSIETESRDEAVRDTLSLVKDYPLTGTGLGTYYTAFSAYQQADITIYYDHTHNDYLEFLSMLGLIGFIPLALLVLFSMRSSVLVLIKRRDNLARGLAFGTLMAIVSLLIHSTVDFNLQMPANALLFVVLLTFSWLAKELPRERH